MELRRNGLMQLPRALVGNEHRPAETEFGLGSPIPFYVLLTVRPQAVKQIYATWKVLFYFRGIRCPNN